MSRQPLTPSGDAPAGAEVVLISVAGQDRQGITARLTDVMARHAVRVLDIGQAVIHDSLAWGMLVEVPEAASRGTFFRDLLFSAHELGLHIRFTPITAEEYQRWVGERGQSRRVITLLGRRVEAQHIAHVARLAAEHGLNIERIDRLSGRIPLRAPPRAERMAIELAVRGEVGDVARMHADFLNVARELGIDVAVQEDDVYRRSRRLVCFDMDSTLVPVEMMDEMARAAGRGEEVAAITAAAMHGEIDFRESFSRRLELLAGLPLEVLERLAREMPITEGAERLLRTLKRFGYRVAIISGGFSFFAERLGERLGFDYVHAHTLEVADGRLTGRIVGEMIDAPRKAELLREIAAAEGLALEQVIAVGDGANDLEMLSIAGLGIAFHAKPLVRARARHHLGTLGLDGILYLIGMRERDIEAAQGG